MTFEKKIRGIRHNAKAFPTKTVTDSLPRGLDGKVKWSELSGHDTARVSFDAARLQALRHD